MLSKAFADETALKEFTMAVENDTCCAILGHNGAGKSTLIKVCISNDGLCIQNDGICIRNDEISIHERR